MSIEKQIDEMANTYYEAMLKARGTLGSMNEGAPKWYAKAFYEAGYRKQSEWISVEERLPTVEENENGLVGIVNGYNGKIRFTDAIILVDYCFEEKEWWSQDYDLTDCKVEYWMPLPEAPKMKGGAE